MRYPCDEVSAVSGEAPDDDPQDGVVEGDAPLADLADDVA